tara:strand:- start:1808 stop:2791 length:984 start_codon:yes stop_codon:yes gene_type:complete
VVERLVANEKVEGSTPFARSKFKVIKSKIITNYFQKFLFNKDIRTFKKSLFYYLTFRIIRNFLIHDLIIRVYDFKVFVSTQKNKNSYYLLKKCDFPDNHELGIIKKFSRINKIFLIDCGCNYGFYSLYTASLSNENKVISIEASESTFIDFKKNLKLNQFKNISCFNKLISDQDNLSISFNESKNDWESSEVNNNFSISKISKVQTLTINSLLSNINLQEFNIIIKLDIEGNEISAINGGLDIIKKFNPIIIIEFSKYIFNKSSKFEYLNFFLNKYDYSIYDTQNNKISIKEIMLRIHNLDKKNSTIGNFYLIKNSSNYLEIFLKNE